MNRSIRFSLVLVVVLCATGAVAVSAEKQTGTQKQLFPWEREPPQRMCVGVIKDGAAVGFETIRKISRTDGEEYGELTWYQGDLESGAISPSEWPTFRTLRRWYSEEGRLWFGFEALYGAFGPCTAELLRTKPPAEIDGPALSPDKPGDAKPHPDQKVLTEACITETRPFNAVEEVERLSGLRPLRVEGGGVDPINVGWAFQREEWGRVSHSNTLQEPLRNTLDAPRLFSHLNDGSDFIPHGLDHWTLFMTVGHTMQIWDCRSKRVTTVEGEEIRNTWTLVTELWVPWTGQFFVFERRHLHEYVLVRDCGEVHLLRLEWEPMRNRPKLVQGMRWHASQLLDPVDYLIALIYIEPENTVYGFGPNFYVRLNATERPLLRALQSRATKQCRDVTQGKAIWTDENGTSRELGEPFRTVWQCAQVLKEEGVLSDPDSVVDDVQSEEE